jgi:hypothetical protein
MTQPIQPVRRKIERSSRPEYQKLINGDSIYTCSKFTSERETQLGDPLLRSSKKFQRSILAEDGPWFFDIEPVLDRRDQDRRRLWKRQKNKRLKRISSATRPQEPQQPDTTITSAGPIAQGASAPPLDTIPESSSRAVTPGQTFVFSGPQYCNVDSLLTALKSNGCVDLPPSVIHPDTTVEIVQ